MFWNRDISSHGHLTNTPGATPPFPRRVSFSEAHPGFWPFQASAQSQVFILIGTLVLGRGLQNLKNGRNYVLLKIRLFPNGHPKSAERLILFLKKGVFFFAQLCSVVVRTWFRLKSDFFWARKSIFQGLPRGWVTVPKRMNIRKSSKWPSNPPPHFRKIILHFFC